MDRAPLRVFVGLLSDLASRVIFVEPPYRTHEWSLIPGGSDVVVEYTNGSVSGYDNVKMPSRYVGRIWAAANAPVPSRLLVRHYADESGRVTARFEEVWNAQVGGANPLDHLRRFDINPPDAGSGDGDVIESCPSCNEDVYQDEGRCERCGVTWE